MLGMVTAPAIGAPTKTGLTPASCLKGDRDGDAGVVGGVALRTQIDRGRQSHEGQGGVGGRRSYSKAQSRSPASSRATSSMLASRSTRPVPDTASSSSGT